MSSTDGPVFACVGTYTRRRGLGIHVYRFDAATGELEPAGLARDLVNPTYIAVNPSGRQMYAVSEVGELAGTPAGAVGAYSVDRDSGELTFLNVESSGGTGPCHLAVDRTGSYVLAANYQGGSVAMLPIRDDGSLGPATDFVQHEGSSVDPARQTRPHAHSCTVDPDNRFLLVADLGLDRIMVYRLDLDRGKLLPHDVPWAQASPGAGPRHFVFHPRGDFGYVINEIGNTIAAYRYDGAAGVLTEIQTVGTLPEGYAGPNTTADIHVSPRGRFLYGSNRGHDSIVIFAVDADTGRLSYVGHESTRGMKPRGFCLDPTGSFLLAANADTNNIVSFGVDADTGRLTPTRHVTEVGEPVCIKFLA